MARETIDYMSDIFLDCPLDEIRKIPKIPKSKEPSQVFKRPSSLDTLIPNSNKGHQLLLKMGYKDGTGLGRNKQGRTTPIPLHLKRSSAGLGHRSKREKKAEALKEKASFQKIKKAIPKDGAAFRSQMKQKFAHSKLRKECLKCLRIGSNLDADSGGEEGQIYRNVLSYPHDEGEPLNHPELAKALSAFSADNLESILERTLQYLRGQHYYCVYCDRKYDDDMNMAQKCPGMKEENH